MTFKRILLGYDGSQGSVNALKGAATIARRYGSELTLLHVIRDSGLMRVSRSGRGYSWLMKQDSELLDNAVALEQNNSPTMIKKVLLAIHSVPEAIVDYSNQTKSDLIVLGTRGLKGFSRVLSGSVSGETLAHAKSPVLIVKTDHDAKEPRFDHILIAVDGSDGSLRAANIGADIAKSFDAKISLVHVICSSYSYYTSQSLISPGDFERNSRDRAENAVSAAANLVNSYGVAERKEIIQDFHSPDQGICRYAAENRVDLVVLGTRGLSRFKRLFLGSVASGVASNASCPVLVTR